MKICVVGCGAMGSIYAGLLADAGHQVLALHTGQAHVDAINGVGLRVEGASGDRTVQLEAVTQAPDRVMDLVIVAVKAAQVEAAGRALGKLIGPDTMVLTIQNGVGSADVLARFVDPDRLCIGIAAAFGAIMRGPGHVFHNGMSLIRIGPYADAPMSKVEAVAEVWRQAGFKTEASADVLAMQWEKLICNVAYSAPCALTGMTVGEVLDDPEIGPISRAAAIEAWTVARALGIAIKVDDPIAHVRAFAAGMPNARPSLLQDLENRRHGEIDVINGAIPAAAARAGLAAPINQTLTALVRQRERGF
ncbi:2-dehydropantoate 2-reductase [Caulobacter sp. AP07]|uniref:ketopantoate reductase family protein n=1 Tax=Caulobacter sp. AP07 TaxID=1144304 RepID=UPI0002720C6B|nr:2-dehydropantoate 2-reductase [Caulobacter sp. AP07]EJL27352.1 2-dehydropantoate 2-reductase [Caulobacter sp. AP07]